MSAGGASTGGCSATGTVPGDGDETAGRDGVVAGGGSLTVTGGAGRPGLCPGAGTEVGSGTLVGGLTGGVFGGAQQRQQCP